LVSKGYCCGWLFPWGNILGIKRDGEVLILTKSDFTSKLYRTKKSLDNCDLSRLFLD